MATQTSLGPLTLFALMLGAGLTGAGALAGVQAIRGGNAGGDGESVRAYLLENPEVVRQALEQLERNQMADAIEGSRKAIETPFEGAWEGNAQGDVTVVTYMDYACGYCRRSIPDLKRLIAADPNIRVVYKELPILSEASKIAAEWSLAAAKQGKDKYAVYHATLYEQGQLSPQGIDQAITKAGLDREAGAAFIRTEAVQRELSTNLSVMQQLGANGTPTWVIGDQIIPGAVPFEVLKKAVEDARKPA